MALVELPIRLVGRNAVTVLLCVDGGGAGECRCACRKRLTCISTRRSIQARIVQRLSLGATYVKCAYLTHGCLELAGWVQSVALASEIAVLYLCFCVSEDGTHGDWCYCSPGATVVSTTARTSACSEGMKKTHRNQSKHNTPTSTDGIKYDNTL